MFHIHYPFGSFKLASRGQFHESSPYGKLEVEITQDAAQKLCFVGLPLVGQCLNIFLQVVKQQLLGICSHEKVIMTRQYFAVLNLKFKAAFG